MELWVLFGVFTLLLLHRHARRLLPRHRLPGDGALHGPAADRRLPADQFGHERLRDDGDPVLHLRRRPDDPRRHRRPADPLRRRPRRPSARRARTGQRRRLHALRRHFGLGHRRRLGGRRHHDPADGEARIRQGLRGQRHGQRGHHRAPDPALAQHDHLFDRGRRHDLGGGPLHGRHRAGPAPRGER